MPNDKPIARWSLIAAAVLIGAALIATVWTTRRGVGDASEALERGQADVLRESVRARVAEASGPPTPEDLAAIAEDLAPDGLRYLGLLDSDGAIAVDAGTPSVPREVIARELARARPGVPVRVGGVLRMVDRRTD
ncbi:MAG TPA: hypothetical protein VFU21_24885, partial [Kofleriaceae bacterium]|nr:hypothetical protein [Kofleriaceae bacterium]